MAPPRKSASQDAAATSKDKSIVVGDVEPIDAHPPHFDVHIEDVGEDHSFPAVEPEVGTNVHETQLPTEGQLL